MINIIIVDKNNNNRIIKAAIGITLYQAFLENGIIFNANCGGKGICGACQVYVDKEFILACKYVLEKDIEVKINFLLPLENNIIEVIGYSDTEISDSMHDMDMQDGVSSYGIAIDVGTTTIGMKLIDIVSKKEIGSISMLNSQRGYGADVISRIAYAIDEQHLNILRKAIWNDILCGISKIVDINYNIQQIVISGNPTMTSIIRGLDIISIGEYPFKPLDIEETRDVFSNIAYGYDENKVYTDIVNRLSNVNIIILECASGYIGSDVLVGATYLRLCSNEKYNMLIDLGTNGEIIVGNKTRALSGSTACGPAFEQALKGQDSYGTNIIDMISKCLDRRLINNEGKIIDRFIEKGIPCDGGIILTQDIIRDIQLAKAAICTGIEILIQRLDVSIDDIDKVYIAGGFGAYLNINNAVNIGMIPKTLENKCKTVGNTALEGTINYIINSSVKEDIIKLKDIICDIDLSNDNNFSKMYISQINF